MKPKLFISHITEEAVLARELKELIEKRFLRTVDVFASSHEDSIKLGDDWMGAIKSSLNESKLVMILCSPISITRPWINFEAGAGWLKGVPVIPLCHSGLTPGKLPVPMNSFQGGNLSNENSIEQLFDRIAEILDLESPDYRDESFFEVTRKFEIEANNTAIIKDINFVVNLFLKKFSFVEI